MRRDPTERHNLYWDPSLASVRDELERRVRFLYETEWVQHTGWASEPTNEAQEAFLANEQYIVPWGCAVCRTGSIPAAVSCGIATVRA